MAILSFAHLLRKGIFILISSLSLNIPLRYLYPHSTGLPDADQIKMCFCLLMQMTSFKSDWHQSTYHKSWTSPTSSFVKLHPLSPDTRWQTERLHAVLPGAVLAKCLQSSEMGKHNPKHTSRVNSQDFKKQEVSLLFQKLHMQSPWDIWCLDHCGRMPVLHVEHNCSAAERTAKVRTAVTDHFCQALSNEV